MTLRTKHINLIIILALLFCSKLMFAQIVADTFNVPNYPIPEIYYTDDAPELPDNVWNHKLKYFPDSIIEQVGSTCGQTAGVFNCMTYMFNRAYDREADSSNIFPPNHTFNQLSQNQGLSTFDSWNLVKSQGHPSQKEYETIDLNFTPWSQGFNYQQWELYWMQNYNNYYKSFFNRIFAYYSLDVKDDIDLEILKHFLHNDFETNHPGGVAIFYTNPFSVGESFGVIKNADLSVGTVETGENCLVYDTIYDNNIPTHCMTLVGYYKNDSIDFNEDGLITDTLDINGDGIIDLHDNETTLWIISNSYGPNPPYLLKYDAICLFWNQQVFFPIPDTTYSPELTFKIRIKHPRRGNLKISAGISSDLNSAKPEILIDFPVFNFYGGAVCMTGIDSLVEPDLLEFGIDITDIRNYIPESGIYKVFMKIENNGLPEGELEYFSIIDYSNNTQYENLIVNSPEIIPSGLNYYSAILNLKSIDYNNHIRVINPTVHTSEINNETNFNILAIDGQEPYEYSVLDENKYSIQLSLKDYPSDTDLIYDTLYNMTLNLNWMLPLASETWDSLVIHNSGEIDFYNEPPESKERRYPYELYSRTIKNPVFSPFARFFFTSSYLKQIAIRISDSELEIYHKDRKKINTVYYYFPDYYAKLSRDGIIEITYSDSIPQNIICANIRSKIGNYYIPYSNFESDTFNTVTFTPNPIDSLFTIDENGVLTMQPVSEIGIYETYVLVRDANGQEFTKRIEVHVIGENIIGSFYPNPVVDIAYLDIYSENSGEAKIEIFNISGQLVARFIEEIHVGINAITLNVKQYSINEGTYICKVSYDDKIEIVKFVVVE